MSDLKVDFVCVICEWFYIGCDKTESAAQTSKLWISLKTTSAKVPSNLHRDTYMFRLSCIAGQMQSFLSCFDKMKFHLSVYKFTQCIAIFTSFQSTLHSKRCFSYLSVLRLFFLRLVARCTYNIQYFFEIFTHSKGYV